MQISKNLKKISWTIADKATFALYGMATVALLQVTNETELGLFTLFNNLHNFIFAIGSFLGLQSILHFSSNKEYIPLVNYYSLLNLIIIACFFTSIFYIFQLPIANLLGESRLTSIVSALPLLSALSIPRYFMIYLLCRELQIFKLFIMNFVYFGTMSCMIFYNVLYENFLNSSDIINITYTGSALSVAIGIFLTAKLWKFKFKTSHLVNSVRYKDIIKFSFKFSVGGIALTIPRVLDVYLIQFFFGTNTVGLYSPAKTIFRFVEDTTTGFYNIIYTPSVQSFVNNDIHKVNSIISKSISLLSLLFASATLITWLFGDIIFSIFLPEKFINTMPIFNYLMLTSILLPITLLSSVISANNQPVLVSKYIFIGLVFWFMAFIVIGKIFNTSVEFIALPYFVFTLSLSALLWKYAQKHYNLKFIQFFRIIPDAYNFFNNKIKKYK